MGSQGQHRGKAAQSTSKNFPRWSLMGSQVQHRVGAAQNKPKDITAREFNEQHSPAPRQSCPKQVGKHHREGS